jgi:putative Ca2+/H+ antiporter (TMEM165/GDT1 family)
MPWDALLGAFGLVFVAELGDKTQLAVLSQTCKHRAGLPVFIGGSVALVLITALGAASGHLLGRVIPQGILQGVAALAFVVMGVLIWREAALGCEEALGEECELGDARPSLWNWRAFGTTAALLFVAELGDKTQLAVLGLASREALPWAVFLGGSLALVAVTALAVLGGQQLCRVVPRRALLRAAAILFVGMGALMALGVI